MDNRRSKLEKYIDLLKQIDKGTTAPIHLIFEVNLSWRTLLQHLMSLKHQELIEEYSEVDDGGLKVKKYRITERGLNVLNYFSRAKDLAEGMDKNNVENWI